MNLHKRDPKLCGLCNRPLRMALTSIEAGSLPKVLPCEVCRPAGKSLVSADDEKRAHWDRVNAEEYARSPRPWLAKRWYT